MVRTHISLTRRALLLAATLHWLLAPAFRSNREPKEIHVMTSGGFTAAYNELTPEFEKATRHVVKTYGASMGTQATRYRAALRAGEPVDVVILARPALDQLVAEGKVVPGSGSISYAP
jgi:molybdate transport system substrate-binding protein